MVLFDWSVLADLNLMFSFQNVPNLWLKCKWNALFQLEILFKSTMLFHFPLIISTGLWFYRWLINLIMVPCYGIGWHFTLSFSWKCFPTGHTLIGYLEVIWHLTMKLFPAKISELETLQNLWHQQITLHCYPRMLTAYEIYFHKFVHEKVFLCGLCNDCLE